MDPIELHSPEEHQASLPPMPTYPCPFTSGVPGLPPYRCAATEEEPHKVEYESEPVLNVSKKKISAIKSKLVEDQVAEFLHTVATAE